MNEAIPAYDTKHLSLLTCHVGESRYVLHQDNASGETGSTLWLSAQILIAYLIRRHNPSHRRGKKKVIELGSGIGLTALALRQILHADVVASDCEAILPLLMRNIRENVDPTLPGQVTVRRIDWCERQDRCRDDAEEVFDMIVMSDVIYAPDLLQPLLDTVMAFMSPRTTLYLAQEVRVVSLLHEFLDMCAQEMKISQIPEQELDAAIQAQLMKKPSCEDAIHQTLEETKDWSGVAIYKMKLKGSTTRKMLRSSTSTTTTTTIPPSHRSDR